MSVIIFIHAPNIALHYDLNMTKCAYFPFHMKKSAHRLFTTIADLRYLFGFISSFTWEKGVAFLMPPPFPSIFLDRI